nr:4-(cytidine 5'-diphospho)-2-C-methyl-D-erythritol kinase [Bilophila sp.]
EGRAAAVMSGSGSSLFGLFRDAGTAFRVAEGFREKDVAAYSHAL